MIVHSRHRFLRIVILFTAVFDSVCDVDLGYSAVQEGSLLIDSSTIDPSVSRDVAKLCANKKSTYMDAPVSGGTLSNSCDYFYTQFHC